MMKLKDVSPKIRKSAAKHMWDFLWDSAYRSVWDSMGDSVGWFVRTPVQNSAQFKNEISERIKNEIG
jgi:hypothetical protein